MTVLYVLISTGLYGGANKSFLLLLKGALKAGINVIVAVPDTNDIYGVLRDMGVKVIVVPSKGNTWTGARTIKHKVLYIPRQLGRIVINFMAKRRIEKLLKNETIDLVHSNNTVTYLGRYVAERRNIPHIYHVREYGDKDFGLRYFPTNHSFHKYLDTRSVYTICITRDIQKHHGLTGKERSTVIYNGIIDDSIKLSAGMEGRANLLYAGRIEPAKGLLELVNAYSQYIKLVQRPLPLIVAGQVSDPGYKQKIDEYVKSHQLGEYITFVGQSNNMPELYKKSKAIVIPSVFEGFGRCMPESMSYGCIVIGRNTGGTKEQFDNGLSLTGKEIGYRYNNQEELVEALTHIDKLHEDEYVALQHLAYNVVSQLYSVDNYVKSVLSLYKKILYK